jgi:transposase InsO family protein
MATLCAYFGISRQAHYQLLRREAERRREAAVILELVRQIRRKHPRMGTRKLQVKLAPMLTVEGLQIGRDRLFALLGEADLLIKRRKTYRRTTLPGLLRTPNRLARLTISRANQVWVSDITYLETEEQPFVYLFVLMDLYSRYIVGWRVAPSLAARGALEALQMALRAGGRNLKGLIHHSDHGVQYSSQGYLETLTQHGLCPSMGAVGNCYDNAFAERVIGTLKGEYALDRRLRDLYQARRMASQAVELYNTDRPHLALDYEVPQAVYQELGPQVSPVIIPAVQEVAW